MCKIYKIIRYSVQLRDWIFVKGYRFLSDAKNMGKNIDKNISWNLTGKYHQKLLDHAKKSAADAHKSSSKRIIQKSAKVTGDLTGNKIPKGITTVPRSPSQNNWKTITHEHDKQIPKEKYITPKEWQEIIDDLRLLMI